jgi:sugar phosphate isomerase/epimerase
MTTLTREVLWSGGVTPCGLFDRAGFAAAHGYVAISVSPHDLRSLREAGIDGPEGRRRLEDLGIEPRFVDAVTSWYSHLGPPAAHAGIEVGVHDFLEMAESIGAASVCALAMFKTDLPSPDALVEPFAALCDAASDHGLGVQLEFVPTPPVGSLEIAWEIVRDADRANAGIIFDTWHFFQGRPDLELLLSIPGDRIGGVQLSDGIPGEFVEGLVKDTFRHRLRPGEGRFPLDELCRVLVDIGGWRSAGPEVLASDLFALSPDDNIAAATAAFDRCVGALDVL